MTTKQLMEHCGRGRCSHCGLARALRGYENKELTTAQIENLFVSAGGVRGNCRPSDHSRRDDGEDWCRPCPNNDGGDSPTHGVGCNGDCHHNSYHLFWSFRICYEPIEDPDHRHSKPGRYRVVEKLHWCDGTPADS